MTEGSLGTVGTILAETDLLIEQINLTMYFRMVSTEDCQIRTCDQHQTTVFDGLNSTINKDRTRAIGIQINDIELVLL